MKKSVIIVSIAALLLLSISAFSQKKISVRETTARMSQGTKNGLTVTISGATAKDVEKLWRREMKKYKAKVGNSKGDIFADDASIKSISDNTIDVYANITDNSEGAKITVFFNMGGAYMSSSKHSTEFKAAERTVHKFAVSAVRETVSLELAAAEKVLKKLATEQKKLENENEKLNTEIKKCEQTIKDDEAALKENDTNQETKKKEIEEQKIVVTNIQEKMNSIE